MTLEAAVGMERRRAELYAGRPVRVVHSGLTGTIDRMTGIFSHLVAVTHDDDGSMHFYLPVELTPLDGVCLRIEK